MFHRLKELLLSRLVGKLPLPDEQPAPLFWLLGKTQSGKSSIVRYVTHADEEIIGDGTRPKTQFSREFAFPDETSPLVRFLDTRGFGEAGYEPTDDIDEFSGKADLVIATVRACDHAIADQIDSLRGIRRREPNRKILVVLTALHDAYLGRPHPDLLIDPADDRAVLDRILQGDDSTFQKLRKSVERHVESFTPLCDRILAVDLTKPEDGFDPFDLGAETARTLAVESDDAENKSSMAIILSHSGLAATAAATPIPLVEIPIVVGIQANMARMIACKHGQSFDAASITGLSSLFGTRALSAIGVRSFAKIIPVVGSAINAAAAFAMTFGTGQVCDWYFTEKAKGRTPSEKEIRDHYRDALRRGKEEFQKRRGGQNDA